MTARHPGRTMASTSRPYSERGDALTEAPEAAKFTMEGDVRVAERDAQPIHGGGILRPR